MVILDIDLIPQTHLLRQVKDSVNFDFICEKSRLIIPMSEENLLIRLS